MALSPIAPAMMYLAPWRSMTRPRNGAMRLPTAVKERDALICDRFHPKASSRGSMNRPKPYCPAPTESARARKGAEITHQPR